MSWPQIIKIMEIFKVFFACSFVWAITHQYPGNIQKLFRLQNCLSRNSSISWKYSKNFLPANLSEPQLINILEIFKDFFTSKHHPNSNEQSSSNQLQRSATATSSSNQQSFSNEQQQSTAAISSKKQQQQPEFIHQPALTQPKATVRPACARLVPASFS